MPPARMTRFREPFEARRTCGSGDVALAPDACQQRREALGLSIAELARRAGLTAETVERFEGASVRPRPVTVVALRNALRRSELNLAIPRLLPLAPPRTGDA